MSFMILMVDGASKGNPGPSSTGWVLWNRKSDKPIAQGGRSIGHATNNEAEWQALIDGLEAAEARGATRIVAYTDSQLVANQYSGSYKINNDKLYLLYRAASKVSARIGGIEVRFVYRQILHLADRAAQAQLKDKPNSTITCRERE